MNARTGRLDVFSHSPLSEAKSSYYDAVLHHLQNDQNLAYVLGTVIFAYSILSYFGFIQFSLLKPLWNLLVYLTPTRIVVALDSKTGQLDSTDQSFLAMDFQAKSEKMQRILGVDNTSSFSSFFPRSTTFSGFGNALLGNKDNLPPGLGNWDNSCYQNSIIQGLASLKSLSSFLENNIDTLGDKGWFSTHQSLKEIIEQLNSASSYGQRLWTPPSLKSMSSWQQQDAQEYFSKVVDQLDREIQQGSRRQTKNMGLKIAGPEEHVVGAAPTSNVIDEKLRPEIAENPSFRNPLEGLLAQRVGCMRCGYTEGLSLIPFNCLTVPLGAKYEHDLQECLDQYMNLEPIEGVECAKCTLLHARGQLRNLVRQLDDDKKIPDSPESPDLTNALRSSAQERLQAVEEALEEDDFAEKTLSKKCHIPSKNRISSTKSRQAVIARTPQCLAIHVNRSLFDEHTGMLRKNYAAVRFPKNLDLNDWCLGTRSEDQTDRAAERWGTNPTESMLPQPGAMVDVHGRYYELRAIITHYGRHENGHYICYRKYPTDVFPAHVPDSILESDGEQETSERWYRLSDDDVQMVSEANVMSQGGVFMLFYEVVDPPYSDHTDKEDEQTPLVDEKAPDSNSSLETPENMSTASGPTDGYASNTSQATSVSTSEKVEPPIEEEPVDS